MDEYLRAAEECRKLQQEYETAAARLDPLRWRLIEARAAADAAWKRVRNGLETQR